MKRFKNRTVVITGGAGAIGSCLVARVLAEGPERVIVIDDLSSGYEWLLPNDSRVEVVKMDVADLLRDGPNCRSPVMFHLAAFFANQNSVDHPLEDLHTNGRGTLTALMWAAQVNASRVVYASAGCSIAGHSVDRPITEDMPVTLFMDTPYQITKALGEFYCNYFLSKVASVRCRFFNSYGPGEVPGFYRNVIPNFIWLAMNGLPLLITGTGEESRDFIFVEDLVDGLIRCALDPAAIGEAINLGTGIETKIVDLAMDVIRICHSPSSIRYAPRRDWDHSIRRQADNTKARSLIGAAPRVRLEEGLLQTVKWFEAHRRLIEGVGEAGLILKRSLEACA